MQKITTHLWFDNQAKEAAEFYTEIFGNSKINYTYQLEDTPSGTVDVVNMELFGQLFTCISAGPYFKFNPSISFIVQCESNEEVNNFWNKLEKGGKALIELDKYPFSERYGWIQDKYGISWQIMHAGNKKITQKIIPSILFSGDMRGMAEEAMHYYGSVFHNSKIGKISRQDEAQDTQHEDLVAHASFILEGIEFSAMDSTHKENFVFNEAISFVVNCDTQKEIDYYWDNLSASPKSEQCGWLKDQYGLSWQVVPTVLERMMKTKNKERTKRVTEAFLKMKKFNITKLEEAFESIKQD